MAPLPFPGHRPARSNFPSARLCSPPPPASALASAAESDTGPDIRRRWGRREDAPGSSTDVVTARVRARGSDSPSSSRTGPPRRGGSSQGLPGGSRGGREGLALPCPPGTLRGGSCLLWAAGRGVRGRAAAVPRGPAQRPLTALGPQHGRDLRRCDTAPPARHRPRSRRTEHVTQVGQSEYSEPGASVTRQMGTRDPSRPIRVLRARCLRDWNRRDASPGPARERPVWGDCGNAGAGSALASPRVCRLRRGPEPGAAAVPGEPRDGWPPARAHPDLWRLRQEVGLGCVGVRCLAWRGSWSRRDPWSGGRSQRGSWSWWASDSGGGPQAGVAGSGMGPDHGGGWSQGSGGR